MKKNIFIFLAFSLLYSCHLSADIQDSEREEEIENSDFQHYSIAIKSAKGQDLLHPRGNEETTGAYPLSHINIIMPPQDGIRKQSYEVKHYVNEWRMVVNFDYEKDEMNDNYIESILELCICLPSSLHPDYYEGIYTYDTIRCAVRTVDDLFICDEIFVNGLPKWERKEINEEPFIELEKERCKVMLLD